MKGNGKISWHIVSGIYLEVKKNEMCSTVLWLSSGMSPLEHCGANVFNLLGNGYRSPLWAGWVLKI